MKRASTEKSLQMIESA